MVERRSLDDALSPEEEVFLKKGTSSSTKRKPKSRPQKVREALSEQLPPLTPSVAPETTPPAVPQETLLARPATAGTGAINARIDPRITTALLRASVERRIEGITPSTQREIIAEALTDWLKKNGFWK